MGETLFSRIISREIKANIIYEDDLCIVFEDINPQAPVHVLIVPKKPLPRVSDAGKEDREILGHLFYAAGKVARLLDCEDAFRLVVNNGADAGQTVFHLHIHMLAKRALGWPPG